MPLQIERLRECCSLLAPLDDAALESLLQAGTVVDVVAGELAMERGRTVERACILVEGSLASLFERDWGEERILSQYTAGDILSVADLLTESECANEIRALEGSRLLCVPRQPFIDLVTAEEAVFRELSEQARAQTLRLMVTRYLGNLFGVAKLRITDPLSRLKAEEEWLDFEREVLERIRDNAEWVALRRGEYLFHQDDPSDGAYILVTGTLRVTVGLDDGGEHEVGRVESGEIVGELALVTDESRSAHVVAMRDCELFHLPSEDFTHIAEKYPRVILNVYRTISERFRKSLTRSAKPPRHSTIAIVLMSPDEKLDALADTLCGAVSAIDSTTILTSESVDARLKRPGIAASGNGDAASISLMQWLNGREARSRFVIYRADDEWSGWNARCISQAELVLVFAEADAEPRFDELKQHLATPGLVWKLVLAHGEDATRPQGTAAWLDASGAGEAWHVRHRQQADIERLARLACGCAVGLVLGGGGARGFAHLGVLRALDELGIDIDIIGGTSMGSPIAGWFAQGRGVVESHRLSKQAFASLIDWTLPLVSMLRGRRIADMIRHQTGDWDIEDYWLPFFCISTNLTTASQVIHRRGNAANAIRASVSIPGVLPPVPHGSDLLVDGGVMNNMPINVMRDLVPNGVVLAIDVAPPTGPAAKEDYGLSLSGWRQLLGRFVPWMRPARAPGIGTVMLQSMMVGSSYLRKQVLREKQADYYQNIHVRKVGLLDFKRVDEAAKIGYESAIEPLKEWLRNRQS